MQLIREWVKSCEQCIRDSRIDWSLTRPYLQNPNDDNTAPDAMQIDLLPESPLSSGAEKIVTAMGVFSRYFFAYPTSKPDAETMLKL